MSKVKTERKWAENLVGPFKEKRQGVSVARSLKYIFIGFFLASMLTLLVIGFVFMSIGYISLRHFAVEVVLLAVIEAAVFLTAYLIVRRVVGCSLATEENTRPETAPWIDAIDNLELAKRVARILRESEETFRTIFDYSGDAIFVHDLAGSVLEVNRVACDRLGYSREELLKLTPMDIDTQEYAEMVPRRIKEIKEKGRCLFETAHVARDGRVIPTEISSRVLNYKGQECIVSTARDITERKEAEEALRESEERYRDLFENASDLIQGVTPEGEFIYVNRAWREVLGYDEEEVKDLNLFDIIHPESLQHCREVFKRVVSGEEVRGIEAAFLAKDGGKIYVKGSSSCRFEEGKPVSTRGIFHDVTERKEAEFALRESEAMLRSVFDTSPLEMGVFDEEGRLVSVNKAALTMFGVPDLGGAKGYNLFEDPTIEDEWKDSLRNGESVRYEREINTEKRLTESGVREPGEKRTVYLRVLVTPLSSEEGLPPAGYMVQGQDIAEQKWAEEEITRLSRRVMDEYEEARRRIAIDLHDEFGQSISALKIEVDMLRKEAGDRLKDQTERLEGMVALLEDTLDKIRSISGELRPVLLDDFGLEKALGMYVDEFSRRTGVKASLDCAGIPAHLSKNTELSLFRIAQEALVNVARHADATKVRLSLLCEDGPIILTVKDNGQGFAVDKILKEDSIHSPFGILGMRERALMVGGEFRMSSKTGKGTTVTAKVPLES